MSSSADKPEDEYEENDMGLFGPIARASRADRRLFQKWRQELTFGLFHRRADRHQLVCPSAAYGGGVRFARA